MSKRTKKVEDYSLDRKITDALISWLDNSRKKPIETIRTFDDFVKAFGIPKENNISLRPGQVSDSLREGLVKYTHQAFVQQTEKGGLDNFFDALYYAFPVAFSNNGETLATLRRRALGEIIPADFEFPIAFACPLPRAVPSPVADRSRASCTTGCTAPSTS